MKIAKYKYNLLKIYILILIWGKKTPVLNKKTISEKNINNCNIYAYQKPTMRKLVNIDNFFSKYDTFFSHFSQGLASFSQSMTNFSQGFVKIFSSLTKNCQENFKEMHGFKNLVYFTSKIYDLHNFSFEF